jgi:hypothetical protein
MQITRKSVISGEIRVKEIDVTLEQLTAYYEKNLLAQDAFPYLSASDREFIMTGITDEEWNDLYPEDEEPSSDQ